jgi:glycosyltransferase involved in cell wall biosynthesis
MKKVLAIAPYPYLPYFSGGQKFIAKFFEYLGKETQLTVISTANDWALAKTYSGITLLKPGFSRYVDLSLVNKISALILKEKFDIIVWEHPYYAWLAFKIREKTGIKTFIHTHNIEYKRFKTTGRWWWPILKLYEKYCFKKADGIFFITPDDKNFAINHWKIASKKCYDLPYGIEIKNYPSDRESCKALIRTRHGINENEKIIFFNGLLDYKPNLDALKIILDTINPQLMQQASFPYKIIICGNRLTAEMNDLKSYANKNIIYAGYTNEIDLYYKASDIFLNPVQSGGGIKTKMVESIAYGTPVVSTETGAAGINQSVCGNKLIVVPDNNWNEFTSAILSHINDSTETPAAYYEYYYWGGIAKNTIKTLLN